MENRTDNYIRNTIWGVISKISMIFLPFLVRTVLIYCLGIEYVGLSSLFSTILQVLSLAELGFGTALVYSMYKPVAENDIDTICGLLKLYRNIYCILGSIILILGLAMIPFFPVLINGPYPNTIEIVPLYLIYLLNTVSSYFLYAYKGSILTVYQRNDIKNKISLVCNALMYCIQICVLLLFKNYYVYIIFLPLFTIISNIAIANCASKMHPECICKGEVSKEKLKEIKKQVVSLIWQKLGNTIIFSFDNIVISMALGLVPLGIYSNYYYIYNSIAGLFSILYDAITAGIGNSIACDSMQKVKSDFYRFSEINFSLIGFCAGCMLCLYQPFIILWQHNSNVYGFSLPALLVVLFVVWTSRRMIHTYKDAAGLWEIDKYRPVTEAIANLCLNLLMVKMIGLDGIVLSTIISMLFVGMPWEVKCFIGDYFKEDLKRYILFWILNILKITILIIILFTVTYYIHGTSLLSFVLKAMAVLLGSAILTALFYSKTNGLQSAINYVKRRLLGLKH